MVQRVVQGGSKGGTGWSEVAQAATGVHAIDVL